MPSAAREIVDILEQVSSIVTDSPQDLSWQSRYSDEGELAQDVADHARRIRHGDFSRLSDLVFLFVPTGPLCEIAAGSGWLETYTALGNRFDELAALLPNSESKDLGDSA